MSKKKKSGCILSFRNDRLGGRLNAFLTAMRISEAYGVPLKLYWALSEGSSPELHHPQDLFSDAFMEKYFVAPKEGARLVKEATDIGMLQSTKEEFLASIADGNSYLSNAATEQLLLPWETKADLECLPKLLQQIDFSPTVKKMIRTINDRLKGVSFRSYHLRRGDIIDDRALAAHNLWPDKYIPRVIYETHMRRELAQGGDGMLVVFSDAQEEARAFSSLSPRIRSFDDLVGDEVLTPLQRDFLELYTMSRSEYIFAPPSSAFSGMAAIIGNKSVTDIEASLNAKEQSDAMDELVIRLEKKPEVFLSQSDIGQNFPFITAHLDEQGKQAYATKIIMEHLEKGMDRAYIYPLLSERLLREGNYDGCDKLIQVLSERLCYRDEHWSAVYLHAALADMVRGNWGRAIQRFHSGSWFYPINRLTSECFWYLSALGYLTPESAYPYDPALMRRSIRLFKEDTNPAFKILMDAMRAAEVQPHQYPANIEVRDWRRLQGKKLSMKFSNKAKIEQQADIMSANFKRLSGEHVTALHSAIGVMLREAGQTKNAERHLKEALNAQPDNALYIKRYADFLQDNGNLEAATEQYARAWELSGHHSCYQVELALIHLTQKDNQRYNELMLDLRDRNIPLVELRLMIAEALRRNSDTLPDALHHIEELQKVAPGSHRILALKAKILEQSGLWDESMSALQALQDLGRPDTVIRMKQEGLYKAYRRANNNKQAKEWFTSRGVDLPDL